MFGDLAQGVNTNTLCNVSYVPKLGDGTINFTASSAVGVYGKVGNFVIVQATLTWTATNSPAASRLLFSLPFTIGNSVFRASFSLGSSTGVPITGSYLVINGSAGDSFVTFQGISTGGSGTAVNASSCSATGSVQIGGFYWIN